jgi:hypothetical protein
MKPGATLPLRAGVTYFRPRARPSPMASPAPEDVSGALRAVWEVRQAEERRQQCLGGWYSIVFGAMAAVIFASYGAVFAWGLPQGPWLDFLWMPPVIAAYAVLAFVTQTALGLQRPSLRWRELLPGTALMFVLFTLLGLAFGQGLVTDYAAGSTLVVGLFYVVLGAAWIREPVHASFGALQVLAAAAMLLLHTGLAVSTVWGIAGTGGGMMLLGLHTLRRMPPGALPVPPGTPDPSELGQVKDTLGRLRTHDTLVAARRRAAAAYAAAALLAVGGVLALVAGQAGVVLFALAGAVAVWSRARLGYAEGRAEGAHGP